MLVEILYLILGVILTFGTAVFVAAEFALVALDQTTVEARIEAGDKKARPVLKALKSLSTQLSGAQVGITLTTILLGYTTQVALADLLGLAFSNWLVLALATTLGTAISAVVINVFSMLFGELVPKNLALADPLHAAKLVARLQLGFSWLFRPIISMLNGSANLLLHRMGVEPKEELSSARSASELAALVRHSADEGTLDETTADMFIKSITMAKLTAEDVMTDRGRMVTLDSNATAADLVALARDTGHTRFPITGESADDIVGLANLRRAVAVPFEKRSQVKVTSPALSITPQVVPETLQVAQLLVELRREGMQTAIVVDEYGGTAGMVTLEDVIEEIVGEVSDEHDQKQLENLGIRKRPDGAYLVPGNLRPDELRSRTGLETEDEGPYETLAGLIMNELGRIPRVGDRVTSKECALEVRQMKGRRATRLLVQKIEETA